MSLHIPTCKLCRCTLSKFRIPIFDIRRWKSKKTSNKIYSHTLNLPQTKFPLSMKEGAAVRRERTIQKEPSFAGLYAWQHAKRERDKHFVLHDGPPYANGDPHVGHALNKILKDITNRYKVLTEHRVTYVPGWDCHGLPIEQKALAQAKDDYKLLQPMEIRQKACKFAEKAIERQKGVFSQWGIMTDWSNCYYTSTREYEAQQLDVFFKMYEKGFIYQGYMPVYWSPSSRTALAEAELEYNDQHMSTSVYVKFPITRLPEYLHTQIGVETPVSTVIWTTTPWTLPANRAICYGNKIQYCIASTKRKDTYLVSTEFVEQLSQLLGVPLRVITTFEGSVMKGALYKHPLNDHELPMLPASHVTIEKGTGLVHTAPAHGHDDFKVAIEHGLSVDCFVDEDGIYTAEASRALAGKNVLGDGNNAVLELMKAAILHKSSFTHSYPYDWRSKQPVIIRASKQWFVDTEKLKELALRHLESVNITPSSSGHGMLAQLQRRPYWCISRQRVWGVPIPAFYGADSGQLLLSRSSVNHLKTMFRKEGSDCWWTKPVDQLLPAIIIEQSDCDTSERFVKGGDIMDIWFDSGSSWTTLLKDEPGVADVYLEGLDQFGGWFQSSLLTSVAVRDKAPYRSLVVHGFVVDEQGQKMSKSVGNVVDPQVVINGGKDSTVQPSFGVDVLRWWSALSCQDPQVRIGSNILNKCNEQIFKMRKCLRYVMGNLYDFDSSQHIVPYDKLLPQDQYTLHRLHQLHCKVTTSYENFNYSRALLDLEQFVNVTVSGFHCHISKDRLYCSPVHSLRRRSAQTVQYHLLRAVTTYLAPVIPHLADEIYQYPPLNSENASVFHVDWTTTMQEAWHNPHLKLTFDLALSIRDKFYATIGAENPIQFDLVVAMRSSLFKQLSVLQTEDWSSWSALNELLQCSNTSLIDHPPALVPDESETVQGVFSMTHEDGSVTEESYLLVIMPSELFLCPRCRRHTATREQQPCARCDEVISAMNSESS